MAGQVESNMEDDDTAMEATIADVETGADELSEYNAHLPLLCAPNLTSSRQLRTPERFIKIFVRCPDEPWYVRQTMLEQASDYFIKAIENEHLGGDHNIGVLRFPEDDRQVWKLLLFWIHNKEMPVAAHKNDADCQVMQALMVKCWVAGEQYLMPGFQNSAALHLIYWLDVPKIPHHDEDGTHFGPFHWAVMKLAFQTTAQESVLRKIFATAAIEARYRIIKGPGRTLTTQSKGPHFMDEMQAAVEGSTGGIHDILQAAAKWIGEGDASVAPKRHFFITRACYSTNHFRSFLSGGKETPSDSKLLRILNDALIAKSRIVWDDPDFY